MRTPTSLLLLLSLAETLSGNEEQEGEGLQGPQWDPSAQASDEEGGEQSLTLALSISQVQPPSLR